jgi:hypothetical protein
MMIRTTHLGALAAAAGALVAVGLMVLMLVVEVRPAEATFPGQNGRIAYSGFEGPGDREIQFQPGETARSTPSTPMEEIGSKSPTTMPPTLIKRTTSGLPTRLTARQ